VLVDFTYKSTAGITGGVNRLVGNMALLNYFRKKR
jgi:hypothetical protein